MRPGDARRATLRDVRRDGPRCSRRSACARLRQDVRRAPDPRSAADRAAIACRIPGLTSSAFSPSRKISRIAGRSDATIARPAAMYSNSLSGEVKCVEIADAGFGSTRTIGCARQRRHPRRLDQAGERDARRRSQFCASACTRARSGSCAWPPTISARLRAEAQRLAGARRRLSRRRDVRRSRSPARPACGAGPAAVAAACRRARPPAAGAIHRRSRSSASDTLSDRDVAVGIAPDRCFARARRFSFAASAGCAVAMRWAARRTSGA